LTALS
jgi:hypothetical protein